MLKGMETLELRVKAQAESAQKLAEALDGHPALSRVLYPGLKSHPQYELCQAQMGAGGTVLSIDVGSQERAFKFLNALDIILISNNLGDAKSIATHPATTTHQRLPDAQKEALGLTSGLVRISIGLEDSDDLLKDIENALSCV